MEFIPTAEGYVEPVSAGSTTFVYVYQYKDHLGNIRLSYADSNGDGVISPSSGGGQGEAEIREENNFYPFGLKHKGYNNVVTSTNPAQKFKYNGVEYEESLGLNMYEMSFRQYDPAIGRFTSIDPVTHYSMSTYTAFDNNPVFWADPSGADGEHYNWNTGRYEDDQGNKVSFATTMASIGLNTDESKRNNNTEQGPDDDITVNSEGVVTKVVKNDNPDRFFDENGNELFFNDPETDFEFINEWQKGDRLFFAISDPEIFNTIIREGGVDPLVFRSLNDIGGAWLSAALASHIGGADFTFSHLVPTYFTQSEKSYLEEGIFRTSYQSNFHFFRFGKTNNIYNLYDAGNYLWGAWMNFNGFGLSSVIFGSKTNSILSFDGRDSDADQRAIINGFNHFKIKN